MLILGRPVLRRPGHNYVLYTPDTLSLSVGDIVTDTANGDTYRLVEVLLGRTTHAGPKTNVYKFRPELTNTAVEDSVVYHHLVW